MRYLSVHLENYIGIYNGMKLTTITIDFTKCKHNLIVIKGDNGSGKSTLFKAINIIPDDSSMFIPGKSAKKIVEIENDSILYRIEYTHEFKNGGYTSKGFFYKDGELCNPNGNITACRDLIFGEFNLDANFSSLAELSSSDNGLVSKIPSTRKQNFNNIIDGVEAYNQIYKTLSKRSSVFKSMINSLTTKIRSIGDEEFLKSSIISIDQRISTAEATRDTILSEIASSNSVCRMLDPDGQIQSLYTTLRESMDSLVNEKKSLYRLMNTLLNGSEDLTPDSKVLASLESSIERALADKVDRQNTIQRLIAKNDDSAAKLNEKKAKLMSISSDTNYLTLQSMQKELKAKVDECEEFFTKANIKDRSMTSDEYIIGLNILLDIKSIVDSLRDTVSFDIIQEAVNNIGTGEVSDYSYPDLESIKDSIDGLEQINKELNHELIHYNNLLTVAAKLKDRSDKCTDPTCFFIRDAVAADSQHPAENIEKITKEIEDNEDIISKQKLKLERATQVSSTMDSLNQICRFIGTRSKILSKLPNGHIFSDKKEFFDKLLSGSSFNEISEIYQYISQASMFEQYHTSVSRLAAIENDLKIYAAKNELIEEITSDIDSLNKEIDGTLKEIEKCNSDISSIDVSIVLYKDRADKVRKLIEVNNSINENDTKLNTISEQISAIQESMNKIQAALNNINDKSMKLEQVKTQIKSLERDRNQMQFSIHQLEDYKTELEEFNAKFEMIEFMKRCSSPTKGIQLIFIELYLRDIIKTANELLSMVMGGEFRLLKPIVSERAFNFPCVGDGLPHDDISSLSAGQSAIMAVVLSASIMFHSSTKYNILKFDEVDGQLDTANRSQFLFMVDRVRDILNCEQCIIITHNNELDLRNADVIILRNSEEDLYNSGANIIFQYS